MLKNVATIVKTPRTMSIIPIYVVLLLSTNRVVTVSVETPRLQVPIVLLRFTVSANDMVQKKMAINKTLNVTPTVCNVPRCVILTDPLCE